MRSDFKSKIFIHIVSFNSADTIKKCIEGCLNQDDWKISENLELLITDNASTDGTQQIINSLAIKDLVFNQNEYNLGFCGGHNQGIQNFLLSDCEYYLCLNPDAQLSSSAMTELVKKINLSSNIGCASPRLIRTDHNFNTDQTAIIDSAGMYITPSLRHFDRGADKYDSFEYEEDRYVFGGSGACLLMKRDFITDMLISDLRFEEDVDKIYPQLREGRLNRKLLFDEAFFAYREDADLAWRAQIFGWSTIYVASSRVYHIRRVTPERRSSLSQLINLYGVRNRFLLQINNYSYSYGFRTFVFGYLFRNLLVIFGCFFAERSSIPAFKEIFILFRRGLERRRYIARHKRVSVSSLLKWFNYSPYTERV